MSKNLQEGKQKIAISLCSSVAKMLASSCIAFPDHGEKVTLCMSTALVGIMGAVQGLTTYDNVETFRPNGDHILFTCLLISNCVCCAGKTPGGDAYTVEWSIDLVLKTMDQFKEMTGRSFETMMNKSLLELINKERTKTSSAFSGTMSKFNPN